MSSIWTQLKSYLRGIGPLRMTGSDVTNPDRKRPEVMEVVACACACADFPRVFSFLTRVVQNGVPLAARMRNRVSRPFFWCFRI